MKDYIEKQKKIAGKLESATNLLFSFVLGWLLSRLFDEVVAGIIAVVLILLVIIPLILVTRIKQWNVYHLEKITKGEE
jgi:hypothetical protein